MAIENKKLKIVMFNMSSYSEWEHGVSNRNWHMLQNLLADERVEKIIAIDYLPHTYKRALKNYKENILPGGKKVIRRSLTSRLFEISDKLLVYSSILPIFSVNKFYDELLKVLKSQEFDDYILISYYPLEMGYYAKLKPSLKIFETVDDWTTHPSYKKFEEKIKTNYKKIDEQCDLIFTVTDDLKNLFNHKEKVFWLPNAVDLKHYQRNFALINRDIGSLPHPIIGYVGTIQERVDLDLIEYLATNNPASSIALVGPVWQEKIKNRLAAFKNIYFLGKKTYEEAPMYIQQFDVAIVPHKTDAFSLSTNPMKIFDYLACGKPVVTTKCSDLEIFGDLVYAANDYQEFNHFISHALDEDKTINLQKRLAFIKEHSWSKRVNKMLELIYQKI